MVNRLKSELLAHPRLHRQLAAAWSQGHLVKQRLSEEISKAFSFFWVALNLLIKNGFFASISLPIRRKIVFGPFLGEVGIELLYWAPTVNFILRRIPSSFSVEIVSRGGMQDWYATGANVTYHEIYKLRSLEQLETERLLRISSTGTMKQRSLTVFESDLLDEVFQRQRVFVVHPGLLHFLYGRFWKGKAGLARVLTTLEYATPSAEDIPIVLPKEFCAVRLYRRETFELTNNSSDLGRRLSWLPEGDLVSVDTGEQYDDHQPLGYSVENLTAPLVGVSKEINLHYQTQVIMRSKGLVVTHGGIAYIGVLLGVDTVALETGPTRLPHFHTALALHLAKERKASFSILNPKWTP